jgi:hypothetical protein
VRQIAWSYHAAHSRAYDVPVRQASSAGPVARDQVPVVQSRKDAFTPPELRGWRAVTLANVNPAPALALFDEAADAFASDAKPADEELEQRGGFWSDINQQLWAKYFRARARVVESIEHPGRVRELLGQARDALEGTEWGFHSSDVTKFHVLVKVLFALISDPRSFSAEDARPEYRAELVRVQATAEDEFAMTFITNAAEAFRGFERDGEIEYTRDHLSSALKALAKIAGFGGDVTEAVRPEIARSARLTVEGPLHTWAHRALESIRDEEVLRRVLLRVIQGMLPLYAQIRHGSFEYGKDIAALIEDKGFLCFACTR